METGWTSEKLAASAKPSDFAPLYIVSVRDKAESVWKVVEQSGGINDVSLYSPESSLVREGVISEMISPLDSRRLCPRPGIQALRSSTSENWWENERREREAVENIVIVLEWRLNRTDLQQPCKRLTRNVTKPRIFERGNFKYPARYFTEIFFFSFFAFDAWERGEIGDFPLPRNTKPYKLRVSFSYILLLLLLLFQ